jgi:hypothetical protein
VAAFRGGTARWPARVGGGVAAAVWAHFGVDCRGGAALLDTTAWTSISDLRRWCCDAKVLPAVLGTHGEVLDLGRATRLATPAQRRALALRDGGCVRPGCTRSSKWCHVHHVRHWVDGGPSDLDNMILVCACHHRELHHTGWTVSIRGGTPEFTPPKWIRNRNPSETPPMTHHAVAPVDTQETSRRREALVSAVNQGRASMMTR